jgi:Flp pilus assembly pilin Flp
VLKKISLDWWAVIAALVAVILVKTVHLTVGW